MGVKQRTAEEKAAIPAVADASVALVAGVTASVAVAPFLMCVDRAVVSAAAGTAPGGSLARAIFAAASEFFKHPKVAFTSPALWICLLYTSPSPRDVEESRMPSSA